MPPPPLFHYSMPPYLHVATLTARLRALLVLLPPASRPFRRNTSAFQELPVSIPPYLHVCSDLSELHAFIPPPSLGSRLASRVLCILPPSASCLQSSVHPRFHVATLYSPPLELQSLIASVPLRRYTYRAAPKLYSSRAPAVRTDMRPRQQRASGTLNLRNSASRLQRRQPSNPPTIQTSASTRL